MTKAHKEQHEHTGTSNRAAAGHPDTPGHWQWGTCIAAGVQAVVCCKQQ